MPDAPIDLEYLWNWFTRLDATRPRSPDGAGAITEAEMGWFFCNRQLQPAPWEIEILASLDRLALQADNE